MTRNFGRWLSRCALCAATFLAPAAPAQTPRPPMALWVSPNLAADMRSMPAAPTNPPLLHPASAGLWPEGYAGMMNFNATVKDMMDGKYAPAPSAVHDFIAQVRAAGKTVSVETGAFYPNMCERPDYHHPGTRLPRLGEYGATVEGAAIESGIAGQVDYVMIDDPFLRIYERRAYPSACPRYPLDFVTAELARYMSAMRSRVPGVKFLLSVSFPHWHYTARSGTFHPSVTGLGSTIALQDGTHIDYRDALDAAVEAARAAGVGFDGLVIDNPYNFFTDLVDGTIPTGRFADAATIEKRWARYQALVAQARSKGLKVVAWVNSNHFAASPAEEQARSTSFSRETAAYAQELIDRQVPVDALMVGSWYHGFEPGSGKVSGPTVPMALLSEQVPGTFMHTVREVQRKLQAAHETVHGVMGYVDGVTAEGVLSGWACSRHAARPIQVHLYVGGPAGQGQAAASAWADRASEASIATACGSSGSRHRFAIDLKNRWPIGTSLYVYGISPNGGMNRLLAGSGRHTSR